MLCVEEEPPIFFGPTHFQHANNMAAVGRGEKSIPALNLYFLGYGRFDSVLGSYSIQGIVFTSTTLPKVPALDQLAPEVHTRVS
jgi:hypothetical protein